MKRLTLVLAALGASLVSAQPAATLPADVLADKIRGGLLGQIIGDLNGLKHENKYADDPGNVESYVPALPDGAWTDDDTDIEWIYLIEMERSRTVLLAPRRIAELWKAHINRRIWCSHKYLRQLLELGIEPPLTGVVQLNPWAPFNLSGQFVSESWGLIAPGMPQAASRIALHYVHTSIEGEPAQSAQLFASMIAAAFLTSDINAILDIGAASIDPKSRMSEVLTDVRRWHRENPEDWRATRRLIRDKYTLFPGKRHILDMNGVILNGAATIGALLYGKGEFTETLRHAFNFGWDADNNAATSGTIIGVIKGQKWLSAQGWTIADKYRNTSRDGLPDETITRFGDRLVTLAQLVIAQNHKSSPQRPANVEPLSDPAAQLRGLQARLRQQIEKDLSGDSQSQARAAYLAIALDLVPALKQRDSEQWTRAIGSLSGYSGLMQVLFYDSPGDPGRTLRERALAAGLPQPPKQTQP